MAATGWEGERLLSISLRAIMSGTGPHGRHASCRRPTMTSKQIFEVPQPQPAQ
jgi:hypothetical protein